MAEQKVVDAGDFVEKISILSGVDWKRLPIGSAFLWFGTVDIKDGVATQGPSTIFQVGQRSPLDKTFLLISLFQNEDEVRAYCVATEDAAKKEVEAAAKEKRDFDPNALRPKRYTLTKISPTFYVEQMADDTFAAEIADELRELRDATSWPEDLQPEEKIDCENCDQENDHDAEFCKSCGKALEEDIECDACETSNAHDAKFCSACGESLEEEIPTTTTTTPGPETGEGMAATSAASPSSPG